MMKPIEPGCWALRIPCKPVPGFPRITSERRSHMPLCVRVIRRASEFYESKAGERGWAIDWPERINTPGRSDTVRRESGLLRIDGDPDAVDVEQKEQADA